MNVLPIAGQLLRSRFSSPLFAVGHRLLRNDTLRRRLVRLADRWLSAQLTADKRTFSAGHRFAEERWLIARAVLHTVDRLIARQAIAPHVTGVITKLWGRALGLMVAPSPAWRRFQAENGCRPPLLITVSPGHACNLHCTGCYANSGPGTAKLPWSILDRVVTEAKALWGIPLVTFSGGEPLAYRSEGKDVLDIVQKHADLLYLMFTNGTLIDKETAARLARLGNLTPAISVEGLRSRTDAWRGAGTFDRVLQAMAHLREAGVPFGISVTVTRANCQEVLADEFLDFFFAQQGAFYGFLFHYMPIGRHASLEAMMTPEQRIAFWRRTWEVVAEKRIFLMDF
ncbi:MAG: radical SAM protein, partial [Chloroflexi bacterium]|nr:radical SAM protein [Chloroflexota bacterium]